MQPSRVATNDSSVAVPVEHAMFTGWDSLATVLHTLNRDLPRPRKCTHVRHNESR